jgi:threonine dehydrogenase-like Zn-dependent dehydrogenase
VTALSGSFAEYNTFDPAYLVKLPENVDPIWALGEPVACCVHAMNRARIKAGDRVAIIGSGFMGLICLQLAKSFGAGEITAIDLVEKRLELALRLGAHQVKNANEFNDLLTVEGREALFNGDYDVVIEAVWNQAALDLSGHLVKQHGLINLVGYHYTNGGRRSVYMNQWNFKAIDVVNGHVRRDDEKFAAMQQGIELAASGRLILEPLVTCFPLSRIEEAFQRSVNDPNNLIKAVITPDETQE